MQPPNYAEFDDWQKVVITTATISGALSFSFMAYVLYGRYTIFSRFVYYRTGANNGPEHHNTARTNPNVFIIHPFLNEKYSVGDIVNISEDAPQDNNKFLSSLITTKQSCYFILIFMLNLSIFWGGVGVFIGILHLRLSSLDLVLESIDLLGLIAQFASQFSALMSCFIFSKVAYAVSNQCFDFTHCIFSILLNEVIKQIV